MSEGLTAGGIVAVTLALIGWGFKRVVNSLVAQNRELVTAALTNMKANTAAIEANTSATNQLAETIKTDRAVNAEKEKNLGKQLDRIEHAATKAAAKGHDTR